MRSDMRLPSGTRKEIASIMGVSHQRVDQLMNRDKYRARQAVRRAVKAGKLDKPARCQLCGTSPERRESLHAHHHDYSKPLEVEWLCKKCHSKEHVKLRAA